MRIIAYRTNWNATTNRGSFRLQFENNSWSQWAHYQASEYQVILMLLQNENPVFATRNEQNQLNYYTSVEDTGI